MKRDEFMRVDDSRNREVVRVGDPLAGLRPQQRIHGGLFVLTLTMICFGLVMLFSASMSDGYASYDGNTMYYVIKQGGITAIGLVLALIIAMIFPVRFFDRPWMAIGLYIITTGLLAYVKVAGVIVNGARRWIRLGPVMLQPSEMAKLAAVFCLASYYAWLRRRRQNGHFTFRSPFFRFLGNAWLDILLPGVAMLLWLVLVVIQPHLSGFLILSFLVLSCMIAASIPWRSWLSGILQGVALLVVLGLLALVAVPVIMPGQTLMSAVQKNFEHASKRINTFSNPDEANTDDAYQTTQSLIAIGSGGLTGIGIGEGRQKYNYLPEAHNDYVFAIIGEELGFFGTTSVLLLFVLFLIMGISIALKAGNAHAAILATGYTMLIAIQGLLNIGVATQTLPATGISLPFFSYGGTSNLFFLLAIGFILSVSRTGQRQSRQQAVLYGQAERAARQYQADNPEGSQR
jgi:cell division protein FtsW